MKYYTPPDWWEHPERYQVWNKERNRCAPVSRHETYHEACTAADKEGSQAYIFDVAAGRRT